MLTTLTPSQPIEVFISYAHDDEKLRDRLLVQLKILKHQNLIAPWHGRQIMPGTDWKKEIDLHLNSAQIILLLVSPDFLASSYCFGVEFKRAMERHEAGEACVIPVILRPCEWEQSALSQLQAVPKDGKPIVTWADEDEAFLDVARAIRRTINKLSRSIPAGPVIEHHIDRTIPRSERNGPQGSIAPDGSFRFRLVWIIIVVTTVVSLAVAGFLSSQRPINANVNSPSPSPTLAPGVRITLTQVPPYDSNGESKAYIGGNVEEARPEDYRVVIYSLTDTWYVQPSTLKRLTEIKPDGTWSAEIQTGTRYTVMLVLPNFEAPQKTESRPAELNGVLSFKEIEGETIGESK